jgi:NTE family protein
LTASGGLASNTPLDLVLDAARDRPLNCILIELFTRAGSRPRTLGASVAPAADLSFGNQTERILDGRAREQRLRALVGRLAARLPEQVQADAEIASLLEAAGHEPPLTPVRIGYSAARDEAGPRKLFDFSAATLADRWAAGGEAMQRALGRLQLPAAATTLAEGLLLHKVEARSGKA